MLEINDVVLYCIVLYDEEDGRLCDASNLDLLAAVLQCQCRCHPC